MGYVSIPTACYTVYTDIREPMRLGTSDVSTFTDDHRPLLRYHHNDIRSASLLMFVRFSFQFYFSFIFSFMSSQAAQSRCTVVRPMRKLIGK